MSKILDQEGLSVFAGLVKNDIDTKVPTKVSQLENDSGYVTYVPVNSVNGQTGDVNITVPSKTSDLQNDSNFISGVPNANSITVGGLTIRFEDGELFIRNDGGQA